jgi:hypothetical protein
MLRCIKPTNAGCRSPAKSLNVRHRTDEDQLYPVGLYLVSRVSLKRWSASKLRFDTE